MPNTAFIFYYALRYVLILFRPRVEYEFTPGNFYRRRSMRNSWWHGMQKISIARFAFWFCYFFLLPWNKNTNVSRSLYIGFETGSGGNFEYVRPKRESVALSTDAFIDHKFAVSCKFHHFVERVAVNDPYNRLVRSSTLATDWPMCFIKREKKKPSMYAYQGRRV